MTPIPLDISRRFLPESRLPDQVFVGAHRLGFRFTDSATLTSNDFWSFLTRCAVIANDAEVFGAVIDNARQQVAGSRHRELQLDPSATRECYLDWLDSARAGTELPLSVDARVIAFTGTTASWGVWIEQDRELAVFGGGSMLLEHLERASTADVGWVQSEEIEGLLAPSFYPEPVPRSLLSKLASAYGPSQS